MSFLESVQHGIEKASQQAARFAKIQHLHQVINDLTFKSGKESQDLLQSVLALFQSGKLTQSELLPACQQILTYQQQIAEVREAIARIQAEAQEHAQQQDAPPPMPPPPAAAYPPYPGVPTPPPPGYPLYAVPAGNMPPPGYPAYPPPGYPPYAYPPGPGVPVPVPPAVPVAPVAPAPAADPPAPAGSAASPPTGS